MAPIKRSRRDDDDDNGDIPPEEVPSNSRHGSVSSLSVFIKLHILDVLPCAIRTFLLTLCSRHARRLVYQATIP